MITLTIEGLPALTQRFQRVVTEAKQAMLAAVHAEAERILDEARILTPIDTGLLVSTGMVVDRVDGSDIRFGGNGLAPYAVIVHEDVTMNHPNGGTHHFLTQPALAAVGIMAERLAADVVPRLRR
jgi:hypothetical protein